MEYVFTIMKYQLRIENNDRKGIEMYRTINMLRKNH